MDVGQVGRADEDRLAAGGLAPGFEVLCLTAQRGLLLTIRDYRYIDVARIDAHIDTVLGFARTAASEAAREIGPLVAGAKPEQIAALKRRFERNTREYVKDWVEPSQDDIVSERSTRLRERIENWIGRLTPAQRDIVDRWAREVRSRSDDSLESRRRWQAAMADLLARTDLAPEAFTLLTDGIDLHGAKPRGWYDRG